MNALKNTCKLIQKKTCGIYQILLYLHHFKQKQLKCDSVAQPVEHNTFNVGVLGSSPSGITENHHNSL